MTGLSMRARGERGSLPLAMLAIIIVGGAVAVLVSSTIRGQQSARYDRDFTSVIQAADAGIQQAMVEIVRENVDGGLAEGAVIGREDQTPSGIPFEWTATKINDIKWEVISTADLGGVTREVHVVIEDVPRFFFAAYADVSLTFTGSNSANSYDGTFWDTENGVVGSNGDIRLNGSSTGVDAVHLFNWDNYPDVNRCVHTGGSDCDDVRAMPDAIYPSLRIGPKLELGEDPLHTAFIDEKLAECLEDGPLQSWTTADDGAIFGSQGGVTYTDDVLCFDNITFSTSTPVTVVSQVEIYVAGTITFEPRLGGQGMYNMNCGVIGGDSSSCPSSDGNPMPQAADLRLYSSGGPVVVGNHATLAAAIYAPKSACTGNGSNAQATLYGSLICGTLSNQGGWSFHYDERLRQLGTGEFRVTTWREEQ